jgi:hypothetical protein
MPPISDKFTAGLLLLTYITVDAKHLAPVGDSYIGCLKTTVNNGIIIG